MNMYGDFIGSDHVNSTHKFIGGDSEEMFIRHCSIQPDDWYYRNVEITYNYNNKGHRCKNFEDIDQDNYILFTGCSHSMGVGVELEKTFPYLLSQRLGADYYNLAIPATGIDVLEYNLLSWFFKVQKKPKFVVIQWPDHSRFVEYDPLHDHLLERGSWEKQSNYMTFIVNSEDSGMFYARKAMSTRLIQTVVDVPKIMCNFGSQQQYEIHNLCMKTLDKARDLSHAGNKSNSDFADVLQHQVEIKGLVK